MLQCLVLLSRVAETHQPGAAATTTVLRADRLTECSRPTPAAGSRPRSDQQPQSQAVLRPGFAREKRASGRLSRAFGEGRPAPRRLEGEPWGDSEVAVPSGSLAAARPKPGRDRPNRSDDRPARNKTPVSANAREYRSEPPRQIIIHDKADERNKKPYALPNNTVHSLRGCPQSIHDFSTERYTQEVSAVTEIMFPNWAGNGVHRGRYLPPPPPRQGRWRNASGAVAANEY